MPSANSATMPKMPQTRATKSSCLATLSIRAAVQATAWQKAIMKKKKMSIKAHHAGLSEKVQTSTMAIKSIAAQAIGADFITGFFTLSKG